MRTRLLLSIAAAIFVPFAGAGAAPQALGLVATNAPVPLVCFAGECTAQLSAFCLQQARELPTLGTEYRPVGDAFNLIAIAADGRVRKLPGAAYLTITSRRSFTAVRISMSQRTLTGLGAVRAAVEVGTKISLVPVSLSSDPSPSSPEEIAVAIGPLRALGDRLVDNGGPEADAVRLVNRVINALPDLGRVGTEVGDQVWRETIAQQENAAGVAGAAEAYGKCRRRVEQRFYYNLRRCLELEHDELILRLNRRYWRAIVGS
ncbi:MAG: hypothetical protein ACE5LL_07645 [Alphaproteobacteria bacterium]